MTSVSVARRIEPGLARRAQVVLAVLVVLAVCIDAGVSAGSSGFGTATLLRLGIVLGALLVVVWLRRFEYFLLVVLILRPAMDIAKAGGGPPVLSSGIAALVVLGVVLWLAAQKYSGRLRPLSLLSRLSVLLLLTMTVSALLADNQVRSLLQVARLAAAVAVLLAVEQLVSRRADHRRVLLACYASAIVPLAVGLRQFATGSYLKQSSGLGRVTGTFLHPNAFGFYLVLLLTMGAAVLRHLDGRARLLVGLVMFGGAIELLLTYSRGSWIAVLVGVLVVGAIQARKLLVLVPVGLILVPVLAPSVLKRVSDLSNGQTINGTPGNSFLWRTDHWGIVLRGARGHELLGIGPSSSDFLGATVLPPHNDFVRMYVETGVLGTTVYLAVIIAALVTAVRALRRSTAGGLERGVAVGAIACTLAFVVGSVGGNLISEVVVLLYMFAFLGAVASLSTAPPPVVPQQQVPAPAPVGAPR